MIVAYIYFTRKISAFFVRETRKFLGKRKHKISDTKIAKKVDTFKKALDEKVDRAKKAY